MDQSASLARLFARRLNSLMNERTVVDHNVVVNHTTTLLVHLNNMLTALPAVAATELKSVPKKKSYQTAAGVDTSSASTLAVWLDRASSLFLNAQRDEIEDWIMWAETLKTKLGPRAADLGFGRSMAMMFHPSNGRNLMELFETGLPAKSCTVNITPHLMAAMNDRLSQLEATHIDLRDQLAERVLIEFGVDSTDAYALTKLKQRLLDSN